MRYASLISAFLLAASLAACENARSAAPKNDIGFVRGCWTSHDRPGGRVTALMRLLPDRDTGATLTGHLSIMHEDPRMSSLRSSTRLTLARDGSSLTIVPSGAPSGGEARTLPRTGPPYTVIETLLPGENIAAFSLDPGADGWTVITGGEETLAIYEVRPDFSDGATLFNGERDGCD